jgi:hypothetical protein
LTAPDGTNAPCHIYNSRSTCGVCQQGCMADRPGLLAILPHYTTPPRSTLPDSLSTKPSSSMRHTATTQRPASCVPASRIPASRITPRLCAARRQTACPRSRAPPASWPPLGA